jgi:hypothetical protein
MSEKADRVDAANLLLNHISGFGRRFFYDERRDRVARFELTIDGRLWFRDDYTDKRVYVAYRGRWRHFSHGGTLQGLVDSLGGYIRTGQRIHPGHFGPWPLHYCDGDLWGYGDEAMDALRLAIKDSPCIAARAQREAA